MKEYFKPGATVLFQGDSITDAGRARIEEFLAAWPAVQDIYRYVEGAQS